MSNLDLFSEPEKPERDYLTIFLWKEAGKFFEATIPRSIKRKGRREAREYIKMNNIFIRPMNWTPFGSWF